jgi:putative heme-binding domain-containing protein
VPSKAIDSKFIAYSLECKNGEAHTGFLIRRDSTEAVIREATGTETRIPGNDIAKLEAQKLSIMPEGLLQNFTTQEAADLVEFLAERQ